VFFVYFVFNFKGLMPDTSKLSPASDRRLLQTAARPANGDKSRHSPPPPFRKISMKTAYYRNITRI
jgi:hypothetical protein